jgi:hypothetical protein
MQDAEFDECEAVVTNVSECKVFVMPHAQRREAKISQQRDYAKRYCDSGQPSIARFC